MHTAIIGAQWGDEGKGKIVDMLAAEHDVVVRYNGGPNAGHTIVVGDKEIILHQVPSGAPQGKLCVIGNGCVVNPDRLDEELKQLSDNGTPANLQISERAHVITPYDLLLDVGLEIYKGRQGKRVGTTFQGIGPAYMLKAARTGLTFGELLETDNLAGRVQELHEFTKAVLSALGVSGEDVYSAMNKDDSAVRMSRGLRAYFEKEMEFRKVLDSLQGHREMLSPMVSDISVLLSEVDDNGLSILFEGAQGTLLDVDHGTYPYCTASNATVGGVFAGTGFGGRVDRRIGVLKAYTTRVGEGAFPTELKDETGAHIQKKGGEFGATTGRPRRVGWLDLVIGEYAARVNGLTELALTKLDVLDDLDEIAVCTRYSIDGKPVRRFPASPRLLSRAEPFYQVFGGWKADTTKAKSYADLPPNAQEYISFIEQVLRLPVKYVSNGPKRDQVIVR
ncbi:MAG: adenylosuccinate synthase [Candidatus Woesearchaeota archaeon]|nr:adenylosuccinate synthase [Candidatus Woesearchaeota archaeon]